MKIVSHNALQAEPVSHDPCIMKQVILHKGDADNITQASKAKFKPGQSTAEHVHADMTEIYTILTGEAHFTVDRALASVIGPATVVIHPGELHSVENRSDTDIELHYIGVLAQESESD